MSDTNSLPATWLELELGDAVAYGVTVKAEPEEIPQDAWLLELEDIEKDTSRLLVRATFGDRRSRSTKNRFSTGDVLYGKLRPYLNKVIRADRDGYCTTEIVPLKANDAVDGDYLFYWLRHPRFLEYAIRVSHGLNMPRLGTESGRRAPFVLAPIREQKRISQKLNAVFARLDACQDRLDRVPQILKKFREAVLEAAVSGSLAEEWRARQRLVRDKWSSKSLGLLLTKIDAGLNVQCEERPPEAGEKGLVKISAVTWGSFNEDESKTLPSSRDVPELVRIQEGDFLISRANTLELVGACVIVQKVRRQLYLSDKVLRLQIADKLKPWLLISLRSRAGRTQIETLASGNQLSMRNLSQANLRSIQVQLPPDSERSEIVRRVNELFGLADTLETRHKETVSKVGKLATSVLSKAFRGQLVPQDPNDEPTEKTLEGLESERNVLMSHPKTNAGVVPRAGGVALAPGSSQIDAQVKITKRTNTPMTKSRQDDDVKGKPYLATLIRSDGGSVEVVGLFQRADLPVADFYKQLAWEVEKGYVIDNKSSLAAA